MGTVTEENPLKRLGTFGQSLWLDYIRKDLITAGTLRRLIEEDGLRGLTSNPAIFEEAILGGAVYEAEIRAMAGEGRPPMAVYEALSQHDVRGAADEFRQVYENSDGRDGYVSLEVNPHLAHDTAGTVKEARRLWAALDRPNVLIKVPATEAGLPAVQELISEGINVNVTLLFGLTRYRQAAEAYLAGLEARRARGEPLRRVASVASFFLSRIDSLVDPQAVKAAAGGGGKAEAAQSVLGRTAIASAKAAYLIFKEIFHGPGFEKLAAGGARPQRLLWASTGTKNPDYSDVKYVDALVGPETVSTVPPKTLEAYRDHGSPGATLESDPGGAARVLSLLPELGIEPEKAVLHLEAEGVEKFIRQFDKLLWALGQKAGGG